MQICIFGNNSWGGHFHFISNDVEKRRRKVQLIENKIEIEIFQFK